MSQPTCLVFCTTPHRQHSRAAGLCRATQAPNAATAARVGGVAALTAVCCCTTGAAGQGERWKGVQLWCFREGTPPRGCHAAVSGDIADATRAVCVTMLVVWRVCKGRDGCCATSTTPGTGALVPRRPVLARITQLASPASHSEHCARSPTFVAGQLTQQIHEITCYRFVPGSSQSGQPTALTLPHNSGDAWWTTPAHNAQPRGAHARCRGSSSGSPQATQQGDQPTISGASTAAAAAARARAAPPGAWVRARAAAWD
jgi:hypothetical protein